MKRILTIQDISCVGKCSLTVALPIISAQGIEACILPTALLSTHTGFKNFTFRDLTDEFDAITQVWHKENIAFDGIYTGFLGSFSQLELIEKIFNEFNDSAPLILVDPCMGDNGKLYHGFDEKFVMKMRELCTKAHVITPNITEASFMCGMPFLGSDYTQDYILELLEGLASFGARKIVLKGIRYKQNECGIIAYDAKTKEKVEYFHEFLPFHTSGTGDIFASVLFGSLVNDKTIETAIKKAANFVLSSIKVTLKDKNRTWYGVQFEKMLGTLAK
ncbi:pyridoxamine kinase [Campylobacter concisus]|uniref:pyridoxal kinase n=1 Tax=Campylobacter concisus TaxID=199 RepID=A0A1Y5NHY8_9BACT|nr:pyridoxamine kinase [Campylobacter concisus]OUT19104.1 phosphomethylpyrimidine kinase [Campylobacter concisus]